MMLSKLFLLAIVHPFATAIGSCSTPSPAFPPIDHVLNKTQASQLGVELDEVIRKVLKNPEDWAINVTSFAMSVTTSRDTIWDYYYTAPILGEYKDSEPTDVSGDTAFRVASNSKTFTVYAVLLEQRINLEDPISKYIPELLEQDPGSFDGESDQVEWDQITIRSLASQLSGIAREGGLSDLAVDTNANPDPIANGFPPVDERFLAPCMKNRTDRACTSEEVIRTARSKASVFKPNDRSTYSNVAFSLLGMVLERVTGKSYDEIIQTSILEPLEMKHTRTTKPKDSAGVIPYGPNDWAIELGADTPSGGIYCTANDFGKYLRSILSSKLLPQAVTNAWMKPHSWTSGTHSAYGMPWEMLRTTKLTPDGRAVDIITKGGSLTQYFTTIILIPELGLGVTILVAGDYGALLDLRENVIATLVPAAEKLIRNEISKVHSGLYTAMDSFQLPDLNWSLRIEVDDVGPGLRVKDWVSNGTDFMAVYGKFKGMPRNPAKWQARLIPTNIRPGYMGGPPDDKDSGRGIWRLTAVQIRDPNDEVKVFDDYCMTDADAVMYDGFSVEEFRIVNSAMIYISGLRILLWHYKDAEGVVKNLPNEAGVRYGTAQVPFIIRY